MQHHPANNLNTEMHRKIMAHGASTHMLRLTPQLLR